ncbi:ribonuclease P protein component [Taylorella equigenitalis 14/56]|uniref:Ribonuclease P protein component n=3 Tax=Taylorella equigenitalis TaxID=29575 RepID=A0A654KGJ8_TAYEM|nr:ribonuclease P protein component [Taylorella equigenitalis]ADU91564.1 Ribonuclease P protein component [Taylorella equigenitalis MCE9]AFN36647.1 ribonuclease P protein component [Taylorella equigenitalis ATCC 35865]ASY40045.1 ribonuclease P protein component [Taylorella equigenitalis]WDU51867.1 ribonuclease P protein component [Taylorella equigenitalis]WDU56358.1 ribonuclease P protein component [Taylorella equigenitalis]
MLSNAEFSFSKDVRLLNPSEFDQVFKKRMIKRGVFLTLHYAQNNLGYPRLGLVVAKKFFKKAVQRNAVKRVIREEFRLNKSNLQHLDLIVRVHGVLPPSSLRKLKSNVRAETTFLLSKVIKDD